jgi:hypothetical protein
MAADPNTIVLRGMTDTGQLEDMLKVSPDLSPPNHLLTAGSYLSGLAFGIAKIIQFHQAATMDDPITMSFPLPGGSMALAGSPGVGPIGFKEHKDGPTVIPLSQGIVLKFVGAALIDIPGLFH